MAGVDVDLAEVGVRLGVHAGGAHEPQRPVDLAGELVVALAGRARRHELLVPGVDPVERGEPALGERAHEVQRGRRLVVRLHEPFGRRHAGGGGRALRR